MQACLQVVWNLLNGSRDTHRCRRIGRAPEGLGHHAHLWLSRRWHQRGDRRHRSRGRRDHVHPGAARGSLRGCDTLFMIGSGFPYAEFLPEEGKVRGDAESPLSDGGQSGRRQRDDAARAAATRRNQKRSRMAPEDREKRGRLVAHVGEARDGRRQAHQSAARLLGALLAPARRRNARVRR